MLQEERLRFELGELTPTADVSKDVSPAPAVIPAGNPRYLGSQLNGEHL